MNSIYPLIADYPHQYFFLNIAPEVDAAIVFPAQVFFLIPLKSVTHRLKPLIADVWFQNLLISQF